MTLDKAIEILTDQATNPALSKLPDLKDSILLSIEALKWIKEARKEGCYRCPPQLPSETPENYHPNTATILKRLKESPLGTEPRP